MANSANDAGRWKHNRQKPRHPTRWCGRHIDIREGRGASALSRDQTCGLALLRRHGNQEIAHWQVSSGAGCRPPPAAADEGEAAMPVAGGDCRGASRCLTIFSIFQAARSSSPAIAAPASTTRKAGGLRARDIRSLGIDNHHCDYFKKFDNLIQNILTVEMDKTYSLTMFFVLMRSNCQDVTGTTGPPVNEQFARFDHDTGGHWLARKPENYGLHRLRHDAPDAIGQVSSARNAQA